MERAAGKRRTSAVAASLLTALFTGLCAGLFACAIPGGLVGREPTPCRPDFDYRDGWLGGDAAYSISLPAEGAEGREEERPTLWLFGDSFVSPTPLSDRRGAHFVHNSIALSRCGRDGFEIEYYWGRDAEGEPAAFFDSGDDDTYWWLFDGFVHDGALYVGLLVAEEAEPDPVLQMPFRILGMKLARIDRPGAPPAEWRPRIATLLDSDRVFPGSAMAVEDEHVYLFAFTTSEDERRPRVLLRLPLAALSPFPEDLSPQLSTWVEGGHWKAGWQPDHALPVMNDRASEMSVERFEPAGRWVAVYGSPIQTEDDGTPRDSETLSGEIFLRHAVRLEGPWSERELLYSMPEIAEATRGEGDPNTVCYAAKGHAAFARPGGLLVSYVCNLRTRADEDPFAILQRLQQDMDLYRPTVVEPPLTPGLKAECTHPMADLWDGVSDCLAVP